MSDDDRSPRRDGDNDRSRSRERSRSPGARGDKSWRSMLESLYERGDIRRGDIDDRIISDLESLSESDASYVLQRLTDSDLTRVRSMSGFIGGIIRRVRQDGPDRGEVTMESLPKGVQDKLEMLIEEKKLEREEVDHRMLKALMDLPGSSAEEALKRFDQSLDSTIRSRQGFLMGIIKRLRGPGRDDRYGGRDGGYGRDRGYGGDRYGGRDRGYGGDRDRYGGRDRGYGGDRYGGRDRYGGGGDRYRGGDRYGGGGGDRHGGSRRY